MKQLPYSEMMMTVVLIGSSYDVSNDISTKGTKKGEEEEEDGNSVGNWSLL